MYTLTQNDQKNPIRFVLPRPSPNDQRFVRYHFHSVLWFSHQPTRIHDRLLGPCFKTGWGRRLLASIKLGMRGWWRKKSQRGINCTSGYYIGFRTVARALPRHPKKNLVPWPVRFPETLYRQYWIPTSRCFRFFTSRFTRNHTGAFQRPSK